MIDKDDEKLKELAKTMEKEKYKDLSEEEIKKKKKNEEMKKRKNIEILDDTLDILEKGSYEKDGCDVKLHFSKEQMQEVKVFLPDDIELLRNNSCHTKKSKEKTSGFCRFSCENIDVLVLAQKRYQKLQSPEGNTSPKILILNLASATTPGGRTRNGASAQEEELCRRTSLLLSLESEEAKRYYDYNNALKTHMGSDAIMISPNVEVIKSPSSNIINQSFDISVMSCAAPMIRLGLEKISQQEYEDMLYKRIEGMFFVASSQNYRNLILGAFGCGVYGNDAAIISDLFYRVIGDFTYEGKNVNQLFDSIDFAVVCEPKKDYNYKEFYRNFSYKTRI